MRTLLLLSVIIAMMSAEGLDDLLDTYTHNSDLSEKTKLESAGTVTVFTRQDLDIMQARNLKDLLKSHPVLRYTESRFGTPDLLYSGGTASFSSSAVRVYLDNQEITSAIFGSGFAGTGDLDLNGIDHVEIYLQSPSFEFSTEPTYLLIKLYSKVAERDRGGRLQLSYGSRGYNRENIFYAQEFQDFSYTASLSRLDDRREAHESHGIPVQRDEERYTFMGSVYSKEHKLQVLAARSDPDISISASPRATYAVSESYYDFLHLGYETSCFKDTFFSIVYGQGSIGGHRKEADGFESPFSPELQFDRSENTLTAELRHTFESERNRLIVGAKFRHKHFKSDEIKVNGAVIPSDDYDRQDIYSLFAEERYSVSERQVVNLGLHYADVENNADIEDTDLFQFRLSHTFLLGDWAFKTLLYHMESLVEPYLYTDFPTVGTLSPQTQESINEEIKYTSEESAVRFVFIYGSIEDGFVQTPTGGFTNNSEKLSGMNAQIEYTHTFDLDNKIITSISRNYIESDTINKVSAFVRSLNRSGKFAFFNELIYDHDQRTKKDYFDYSAGVKYHHDKDLTFSIKGENIFNTGYEESYFRIDPNTGIAEEPLLMSPVEQRFYATVEYLF